MNIPSHFNKSLVALALTTGLFLLPTAQATTVNIGASVTVNNTVNVAFTPLNLGTVSATLDGDTTEETAKIVFSANPAVAPVATQGSTGKSTLVVLTAGTPAVVTVSGAAPNYDLNVSLPSAPVTVTDPAAASTHTFTLSTFTKHATTEGNNQTFGTTTTATGDLVFGIGATLTTTVTGAVGTTSNQPYDETTYTAIFPVSINY